jgi:hypothetical protein
MPDLPNLAKVDYVDRVNRAIDHVTRNLAEPLKLEDVAKVACFSSFHFHRIFRAFPWEQVALFRAQRHRLHRRAPRGAMLRVAGEICGLHAQVLSSAELSLWARVDQFAPAAVERALWSEGSLVKTWAMRGTLHLLPRAELPLFFGALSTYTHFLKQHWLKYFGVTRDELEEVIAALAQTLPGRVLTREELAAEVARWTGSSKFGTVLRQSWGVMLKPAAFRGQLCFAESEGQRVRFTHPGAVELLGGEEALCEMARRYLAAYNMRVGSV